MPERMETTGNGLDWENGTTAMNLTANVTCLIEHSIDHWLFSTTYTLVFFLGLPTNCISLYAAYKQVQRGNELGIYLFNLSLADLLYILTLPFWIDFTLHQDDWRAGAAMCQLCSFLTYTNLYVSGAFLCCISFDRYLGVVHPLRATGVRTMRAAVVISCAVWAGQSAFSLVLLIRPETADDSEHHRLCYDIYPIEPWKATLNYFRVALGFLLPLALLLAFHCRIYRSLRDNMATRDHEKRKAKQLMLSIVVGFTVCFAPYHATLLARSVMEPGDCSFARAVFIPYRLSVALVCFNCIMDPVLYCFVSETSRRDILFFALRGQDKGSGRVRRLALQDTSPIMLL
uniref:ovarian cancer G-protein coupled receptor 1-like n=1 Tax=Pristiophorus japonicus TaxID=55135 RepID=UPI00398E8B06